MGREIERKYLVAGDGWRTGSPVLYRQGYLCAGGGRSVRVRLAGDAAFLTIKGSTSGITRAEFEYGIPVDDAVEMLGTLCEKPLIEKERHRVECGGLVWEIDEFFGENEGLLLAEVELESEEQEFERPDWLGEEVSGDPRYYNANLVKSPFREWGQGGRDSTRHEAE